MSTVGIGFMLLGAFIVCSRGPLLLAPASVLRGFRAMVKTATRTRILGVFLLLLLAAPIIWAGVSEESTPATALLFIGWSIVGICVPALVLFPRVYMNLVDAVLPADPGDNLFGWRLLGLVGVIIGAALFQFGVHTL